MEDRLATMTEYDRTDIPAAYDRGRDHGPEVMDLWMREVAARTQGTPARILDLGCGTGRFADALSVRFNAEVLGLDPSFQMLSRALAKRRGDRVRYIRARGEAMPVPSASIDLIFSSMCFHHFTDPDLVACECRRVLRGEGRIFIRTGTREQVPAYAYYPFFPTSHPILEEVLPDSGRIRDVFEGAGFQLVAQDLVTQVIAPDWATYADKLGTGADSVLARLDREDFNRGVEAVRQHAAGGAIQAVTEPIDVFVFR